MKTILRFRSYALRLIALSLLFLPSILAGPQQILRPIRVALPSEAETPDDHEFNERLRAELNKFRDVAITARRVDVRITTVATPITKDGRVMGYAVAVAAIIPAGKSSRLDLSVWAGPTLADAAPRVASMLDRDVFAAHRSQVARD